MGDMSVGGCSHRRENGDRTLIKIRVDTYSYRNTKVGVISDIAFRRPVGAGV